MEPLRVFIGHDPREALAWEVCAASLRAHASVPVAITRLGLDWLQRLQVYRRPVVEADGQLEDGLDGRPMSTEFAFSRFLVPALAHEGWALFCDSDFLWRRDVAELWALRDQTKACMVVQHDHRPAEVRKMRGQVQTVYPRKNWSSLVLWNASHPATRQLTVYAANHRPGRWLHGFSWLREDEIGSLPVEWNWLEGVSGPCADPGAVHYTRGTPDMPGYEDSSFAAEWWTYARGDAAA